MTRRNLELVLLCIAAPIVVLMFAMLAVNQGEALGLATLGVPLGMFVAFVAAHVGVRLLAPGADPAILPIVFALSGIGIAFITRIAPYSDAPDIATNQVIWLFLGVACMVAVLALFRNLDKIANYKYTLMLVGFALLLSPLIPGLGMEIYGSQIWISIGGVVSFQPGEIAKIVIVLFLAGYLASNREMLSVFTWRVGPVRLPDARTLLPMLLMWGISLLIVVFEKDLGSALVFFFVFIAMLYVATGRRFYLVVGLVLVAVGGVAAWALFGHVQDRVDMWLDPWSDPTGAGYQIVQSIYSLADGDLFGVGIGRGMAGGLPGISQLPVVESDFIFSAIGEETGLLGAAGLLLLYLCFAIRGMVTAARAKSDVSSFIAAGLTSIIVLQAFIIVGGITRLIPLTGITLPFVSQGGTSLIAGFIIVGFLLRAGDDGTGVESEMRTHTTTIDPNSVLGRVALGKRLTTAMRIFAVMFAVLVANLTLIMVIQANDYRTMEGNNHTIYKESQSERGTISTSDGVVLAQSVENEGGTYDRVYPAGDLASQVVGYYSTQYGASGIEAAYNATLKGEQNLATFTDVVNLMAGVNAPGNDVVLTLNSTIQQAAQDALSGYAGACVVLDPETGAVLAMASSPTYNAADFEALLTSVSSDTAEGGALVNRATQALYAPGSTFKSLTLAAALSEGVASEDTVYSSPSSIEIEGAEVTNFNGNDYGEITLARATELSSNTAFAQVGLELGAETLVEYAEAFGFNDEVAFELPLYSSLMPDPSEMSEWETAWAADGQPVGQHESPAGPQATVLQMAMVFSAFANDGVIQAPYLVDGVYNANGERSYTATPTRYAQVVSSSIAERVTEVLKGVVSQGTGTAAAVYGVEVAGKTGTAETGREQADSWFAGYAPADDAKVVVAIVLEQAPEGAATARANNVLTQALQVKGLL